MVYGPSSSLAAAAAKSHQSCPTLCDPIDGSSPGSPFPGILQARTLEWVAIYLSSFPPQALQSPNGHFLGLKVHTLQKRVWVGEFSSSR